MSLSWPSKDPDEILDYDLDWTARLDGDTIATSSWIIDQGTIAINSNSHSNSVTKVWLSGGALLEKCILTNRITTAGLRTMDQSVNLKIKSK